MHGQIYVQYINKIQLYTRDNAMVVYMYIRVEPVRLLMAIMRQETGN